MSLKEHFFPTINILIELQNDDIEMYIPYIQNNTFVNFNFVTAISNENITSKHSNVSFIEDFPYIRKKTNHFYTTISLFYENNKHNAFYNRTIFIQNGNICNYAWNYKKVMKFLDYDLSKIELDSYFTQLWDVSKNNIVVCKDCEYRNICIDNRIPIIQETHICFEVECPYNPYIAKWQGEEGYVPVEECGTYTKEKGFVVNKQKVNKLNKQVWGE